MSSKWSIADMIKLIEQFKAYPSQWNQTSREYRKKKKKERDLCAIAGSVGVDKCIVERKWKSLRTIYKSELNKIVAGKRSGKEYFSSWRYFGYLRFLYEKPKQSEVTGQEVSSPTLMENEESHGNHIILNTYQESTDSIQRTETHTESEIQIKWSEEKINELIRHYEVHPVLWDPNDVEFRVNYRKVDALAHIAKSMGLPKDDVKRKWRILRTQFKSELNKMSNSKSIDDLYVSNWRYLIPLKFLYDSFKEETVSNEYYIVEECDDSEGDEKTLHSSSKINSNSDLENTTLGEAAISTEVKQKWSPQAVYRLIQQYKERPSLWDRSIKEYRVRNIRENYLSQVAENMRMEKEDVERKWKSLRTHCKAELRRMIETKGSNRVYFSNWRFLKAMKFVYDSRKENETNCNGNEFPCESDDSVMNMTVQSSPQEEMDNATEYENTDSLDLVTRIPKKLKSNSSMENDTNASKLRKTVNPFYESNECDIFCSLMATKLRKLNRNLRDEAMKQLMRVMWDFEDAQKRSSTPASPFGSFESIHIA